jgi:hypothetical protein
MAALTLQDAQGAEPPAPAWIWTLEFDLTGIFGDVSISDSGRYTLKPIYVQEVTIPFRYFDAKTRYRGGGHNYFAGDTNLDHIAVNFYETSSFSILSVLSTWQGKMYYGKGQSKPGCFNLPANYFANATARLYDGIDNDNAALEVTLSGIWPARISEWNLNYQHSSQIMTSCTFYCNDVKLAFKKQQNDALAQNIIKDLFSSDTDGTIAEDTTQPLTDIEQALGL